jgi:Cu/Ag efflux pump CusA
MRWALGSSLRFGRLVIAVAIGLMVFGVAQLRSAPVDVYPEFTPPAVEIQTEALGLSAAEVEQLITVPLEQDLLNGVPFLEHIHSSSRPGLSAIDLTFVRGTDIYAARQLVQERMTQAHALPNVGSPPIMIQPLASASRVAMIGLSSRSVSPVDMSVLARWKIRPRLMGVPGVANVSIYGQRDRQLQVRVDPARLAARGVSLTQVIETTGNALWVSPLTFVEASTPGTGGFVESANQRLPVQHISPISTPQQLSQVPVQGHRSALRLGDVTSVIQDHQPLIGDAVSSGAPSLYLVVDKFPGASTLQVTRDVEAALADMAPGLKGISIDTGVYRPASYIDQALGHAGLVALAGLVLLVAAMFLLFASWRAAVIALIVVPVSLVAAAWVLDLRGTTFSTMTLLGLAAAVGLVIDDVVADIDAVRRQAAGRQAAGRQQAGEREQASGDLVAAFSASRGPLAFATLAILIAVLPFLFLGQLATAFSGQLILTYALAVLASMLAAFTLTPALASALLGGDAAGRPSPFGGWVSRQAGRLLRATALRPRRAWAAAGVLALAALAIVPQLGGGHSLLPAAQDRNLLVQVHTVAGTGLPEMDRIVGNVGRELRGLPGVQDVGAHVGRAISSDQLVNVNSAELWITLDGGADYARTTAAIRSVLRGYPGLSSHLGTYPGDRVAQVAASQADDLVVRVYGADLGTLTRQAARVRAMLAGVPGVSQPKVRPIPRQPTVDIRVNLAAAQRHGLRPGDVRRDVTTLTSGLIVGNLYEQSKIFDVVVWGAQRTRSDLTELGGLLIDTPSGDQVALRDVATLTVAPEPAAISHDGVERDVAVAARVTGDPAAVVAAVRSRLAAMPMPYEYHAEVSGNATIRRADLTAALAIGAVALVGILLLLQAAVASWRRACLLLASVPLSMVGGVLIAPATGGVWNAGSLAGLFAVFALAVRASFQLGAAAGRPGTVLDAARDRAVPMLQSALVTAAVLAPAALLGAGPGLEMLRPLAVTVLGGLVTLAAVQGYLLPVRLAGAERRERREPEPAAEPRAAAPAVPAD